MALFNQVVITCRATGSVVTVQATSPSRLTLADRKVCSTNTKGFGQDSKSNSWNNVKLCNAKYVIVIYVIVIKLQRHFLLMLMQNLRLNAEK
jgi:hypothetical protein